jgi:hypothetical protein
MQEEITMKEHELTMQQGARVLSLIHYTKAQTVYIATRYEDKARAMREKINALEEELGLTSELHEIWFDEMDNAG